MPAAELQTITITWPIVIWNLDMVGPFRTTKGGFTHPFMTINKFTKWIEAKSVDSIKEEKAVKFITKIIH